MGVTSTVIGAYAPTAVSKRDTVAEFYDELEESLQAAQSLTDRIFILGDFNVDIGVDARNRYPNVVGPHGLSVSTSSNAECFLGFCNKHGLLAANSYFPHKPDQQITWIHPKTLRGTTKDWLMCSGKLKVHVIDIRVLEPPSKTAEHGLLCVTLMKVGTNELTRILNPTKKQ